jgi:hypothetical protein
LRSASLNCEMFLITLAIEPPALSHRASVRSLGN